MGSQKFDFILDLDNAKFSKAILESKADIESLVGALGTIAKVGGVITAGYLAVKTALDLTFQAEQIKSLNTQFDILSRQSGIAGESILRAMDKAADGLISGGDLTRLANRAMVQLGQSASRMPEIMALARKASVIFGEDVASSFEKIAEAVATGQTKQLKQLGILIDTDKVYRDYARSIGVAENALSDAGKRQAILNEALKQGAEKLADVDTSVTKATDTWTQLKNVLGDVKETAALAFEGLAGKQTRGILDWFRERLQGLKEGIETEILGIKPPEAIIEVGPYKNTPDAPKAGLPGKDAVDKSVQLQNQAQFQKDLIALEKEAHDQRLQMVTDIDLAESLYAEQKLLRQQQTDQRLAEIDAAKNLTQQQKEIEKALVLENAKRAEEMHAQEIMRLQDQIAANAVSASNRSSNAFAEGFRAAANSASRDMNNFGAMGSRVFSSFGNHANRALTDWANGQGNAADAAKKLVFGVLADEASARGQMLLLSSIWPPNPAGLAAGAGLIGLAAFLRSQSGGGGGGEGAGAGGGASASGPSRRESFGGGDRPALEEHMQKKAVTIQVMGSYFETEQTKTKLVEMIREASDATDFSFKTIG